MFVGRKKEIEALNSFYEDDNKKVLCLYGQLGMGKTTLLREFSKDKKHIYHTAYPTTDVGQMVLFARAMGEVYEMPRFANTANLDVLKEEYEMIPSFEELLEDIEKRAGDDKLLLIIDQYSNFVKADSGYDKILFDHVTKKWSKNNIKLIICTNSFLAMDKFVLGKKAIWNNVDKEVIELRGMDFYDSCKFFPERDGEERAFLYGLTGGIPEHLSRIHGDMEDVARELFLKSAHEAGLMPEATMSLDLRELSYYNRILMTLAQGNSRVNQISALVNKPKDVVVPYMNTLISIGVVEKNHCITEPNNRKKTRYGIVNTNYLFWYRYVAPNIDWYYTGKIRDMWDSLIEPELDDYMKLVFVRMCKEYLKKQADEGNMPFTIESIGNWWENDEEKGTTDGFDLVALGKCEGKTSTVFARCYYNDDPIEMATLKDLIELTKRVSSKGDVFYIVFSKNGFHENTLTVAGAIKNIMLISLEDVVKL